MLTCSRLRDAARPAAQKPVIDQGFLWKRSDLTEKFYERLANRPYIRWKEPRKCLHFWGASSQETSLWSPWLPWFSFSESTKSDTHIQTRQSPSLYGRPRLYAKSERHTDSLVQSAGPYPVWGEPRPSPQLKFNVFSRFGSKQPQQKQKKKSNWIY